jgi:hypothetical protein
MTVVNGKDKMESIKFRIKEETKNLLQARKWLESRGWTKPDRISFDEKGE